MPDTGPDVRGAVARYSSVVNAGFGPQLYIDRLRAECARMLDGGIVTAQFRHYLNQYALWADAGQILAFAAALRSESQLRSEIADLRSEIAALNLCEPGFLDRVIRERDAALATLSEIAELPEVRCDEAPGTARRAVERQLRSL